MGACDLSEGLKLNLTAIMFVKRPLAKSTFDNSVSVTLEKVSDSEHTLYSFLFQ